MNNFNLNEYSMTTAKICYTAGKTKPFDINLILLCNERCFQLSRFLKK